MCEALLQMFLCINLFNTPLTFPHLKDLKTLKATQILGNLYNTTDLVSSKNKICSRMAWLRDHPMLFPRM